jgi:DNA-binding CsgD family transcriptional regulator
MTKIDDRKAALAPQSANEIILAHPVFGLMRWLANSPSGDEVARELTLNYFQLLGATQARLATTDANGTLRYVGDFGFEDSRTGITLEVDQWQALGTEIVKIEIGQNGLGWSSTGKYLQARVNDFGDTRGWITIGFADSSLDRVEAEQLMQILKHVVGIYLAGQHNPARTGPVIHPNYANRAGRHIPAGREAFTPRQLSIVAGMVEGKTNHELASELGFSVSTIRHETMRIYQILSVSDRREAAREAMERKIF